MPVDLLFQTSLPSCVSLSCIFTKYDFLKQPTVHLKGIIFVSSLEAVFVPPVLLVSVYIIDTLPSE